MSHIICRSICTVLHTLLHRCVPLHTDSPGDLTLSGQKTRNSVGASPILEMRSAFAIYSNRVLAARVPTGAAHVTRALLYTTFPINFLTRPRSFVAESGTARSTFGDFVVIAFLLAQALDGAFTYIGIKTFGPSIEGNPLLTSLMGEMGHGVVVMGAKMMAATFGMTLHLFGVHRIVALLTGLYMVVAIVPWTAVLFFTTH